MESKYLSISATGGWVGVDAQDKKFLEGRRRGMVGSRSSLVKILASTSLPRPSWAWHNVSRGENISLFWISCIFSNQLIDILQYNSARIASESFDESTTILLSYVRPNFGTSHLFSVGNEGLFYSFSINAYATMAYSCEAGLSKTDQGKK